MSTVRLQTRARVHVDLLAASSGIESEIVGAAGRVSVEGAGELPVATAEDLLACKVLSMSDRRPQDLIDARGLVLANPEIDLELVRRRLALIRTRGFHREQDLDSKLDTLLAGLRGA